MTRQMNDIFVFIYFLKEVHKLNNHFALKMYLVHLRFIYVFRIMLNQQTYQLSINNHLFCVDIVFVASSKRETINFL